MMNKTPQKNQHNHHGETGRSAGDCAPQRIAEHSARNQKWQNEHAQKRPQNQISGEAVRIFQTLLNQNRQRVKIDGVFGAATKKALRKYVKQDGGEILATDGRAGSSEWCWLLGGSIIGG